MTAHAPAGKVRLSISLVAGDLRIEAVDVQETTIDIQPRNEAAREMVNDIREERRDTANGHDITLEIPARPRKWGFVFRDPKFDVTIQTPLFADLDVTTVSADIRVTGIVGKARVQTTSGDVKLEEVEGSADIKTVSGDIEGGSFGADLRLQTISGDATFGSVEGRSTLKSVSGDLALGAAASDVRATSVSGDIRIDGVSQGGSVVKTTSGDVTVGVAPGAVVWMDISSLSGDTSSDLEAGEGSSDQVDVEVRASSLSGDVHVRRAVTTVNA